MAAERCVLAQCEAKTEPAATPRCAILATMRRSAIIIGLVASCASAPRRAEPMPDTLARLEASADLSGSVVGASDVRATIVVVFASWCTSCRGELAVLDNLRAAHPKLRILGVNYKGHEEYDHLGSSDALITYVAANAPWLRVVPCEDALFASLGSPPKIPTLYIYDVRGALVATFDRRDRPAPSADELEALLRRLGA
jgi:thiol-disulfide isomerase/thioredoxin